MTVLMTPDMANFSGKVHGGAILKLLDQVAYACNVNYVGRSSMEVGVKAIAENLHTKDKRRAVSCFFTMVALDVNGKTQAMPNFEN